MYIINVKRTVVDPPFFVVFFSNLDYLIRFYGSGTWSGLMGGPTEDSPRREGCGKRRGWEEDPIRRMSITVSKEGDVRSYRGVTEVYQG